MSIPDRAYADFKLKDALRNAPKGNEGTALYRVLAYTEKQFEEVLKILYDYFVENPGHINQTIL